MQNMKYKGLAIGAMLVALVAVAAGVVALTKSNKSDPAARVSSPAVSATVARAVFTATTASANPTSGPGYTSPTAPSGAKVSGGTVYFTEGPDAVPNYIFPLYTFADCSTTNINQLMDIIYRPVYWYGNNYSPTIDYGNSIGKSRGSPTAARP